MDTFVEELRRKRGQINLEGETQDVHAATTTTAPIPGIYLPLLPRYFHYTTSRVGMHSEFQKAKEGCLNCIQDSLLQGQLQRAAELIISYIEMLEHYSKDKLRAAPEEIWRIGTEILQRHPRSNIQETNHFADQMKNLGVKGYLKVSLEHAFHLLCNGFEDEAYQNLVLAESWKYGEQTVIQNKELKLIQGYRGLLDYSKWLKKKADMLGLDEDSYAVSSIQQEMRILYRQAKVSLKEIIKIPGVWDPFVTCYVDMLEHYEEYEEAREVLSEYAYNSKFPPNPNAHVFLYQFLKRRGESRKTQMSALQILHELVPSHELMLEYYAMLKKSKKRKNQKLRLEVIFAALDSAGWKENVKAWSCLAKDIVEILQNTKEVSHPAHFPYNISGNNWSCSDKQLHWLKNKWASRKDWWPALHFSLYLAKRNWQEDECLACEKVLVAGMLMGKDCKYFRYVMRQGCEANKKKFKPLKTFVKKHSWVSLKII